MNQVALTGRLTRDLELRTNSNGTKYVAFTIAVSEFRGGKEYTNFISCFAFERTAENMVKYVGKGSLVGVTGRISARQENNNGQFTSIVNINADRVEFLESRNSRSNNFDNNQSSNVTNNSSNNNDSSVDMDAINGFEQESSNNNNDNNNQDDAFKDDDSILWD